VAFVLWECVCDVRDTPRTVLELLDTALVEPADISEDELERLSAGSTLPHPY